MDANRPTLRHIIIKRPKVKDRLLKAAKELGYQKVVRWEGGRGEDMKGLRRTIGGYRIVRRM